VSKPPAKAPAKAPAKSAGKTAPKVQAKPAATKKPAAKPAPKAPAKAAPAPAPKAPAKPAAKAPPKPEPKPTPAAAAKPVAKSAAVPAPKTTPAKPAASSSAPAPAPTSAKAAPGHAMASNQPTTGSAAALAPVTSHSTFAAPVSNRFTDRFAPPRPTAPEVIEASSRPPKKIDPKLANAWKTKAGRDLTDDELLAMPDSEYMSEKQLEFFRTRLTKQKDDLLSNAGETTEHLREDTSIVPDPVDRATIEEEHALELRTRDRERKLLKKISQSLARLESGDYGYCDETGEPIGLARLLARPTATLSLEAQQRRELKQKMFGD
jgi:DnaK suppressor protein